VDAVSDKQAEDVLLLDIRNVASFADYFVIASGTANRQIQAIIEAVELAV
jgi:ribosome-associated protein